MSSPDSTYSSITTSGHQTEADAVADLTFAAVEPDVLTAGDILSVIVPAGAQHKLLDLEEHLDRPRRKRGTVELTDVESLIRYVNAHKGGGTELFADIDRTKVVAVLNGHEQEAGWGDHRAVLTLRPSIEWKRWSAKNGQTLSQTQFAEHIEESLDDIVEPAAASVLEMAQTFEASKSVEFRSSSMLSSGQRQLNYVETIEARAGAQGQLTVPTEFVLGLRPFEGTDRYKVTARFRYRINDGKLAVAYVLDKPEDVIEAAFADILGVLEDDDGGTGIQALRGTPRGEK